MKRLTLASLITLFVSLIPTALNAQTVSPTPAPFQNRTATLQEAELEEAEKLNASVAQLYAAGNYKEALPMAERVLALCEKVRREEDPLVGTALNNLAAIYIELKEFRKVEPILERILARREKQKTATSPMTLGMLVSYGCLVSAKHTNRRSQEHDVIKRINSIFLLDAVHAAGLPLPEDLSVLKTAVVFTKPQPLYPRPARDKRLQGTVLVWGEADETGKIVRAEALPCWKGQQWLTAAAVDAVRAARFKPIVISGKPLKLKVITTYSFIIE